VIGTHVAFSEVLAAIGSVLTSTDFDLMAAATHDPDPKLRPIALGSMAGLDNAPRVFGANYFRAAGPDNEIHQRVAAYDGYWPE
jgi:hypothetical protein